MGRVAREAARDLQALVNKYSRFHQSTLSIEQFTSFGKSATPTESFEFLKHEVPVRLAHIMKEINLLPRNLRRMPSVELVKSWYVQSFLDLMEFHDLHESPISDTTLDKFAKKLLHIKRRHDNTVETMAQGVIELRDSEGEDSIHPSIQYFLDRFYMNRISVRLLMTQHLALFDENISSSKSKFIGVFDPNCNVSTVVQDAADNARLLCDQFYYASPDITVKEHNAVERGEPINVAYVPSHLYHMIFELVKNAMRAVIEYHGADNVDLPRINVLIGKGNEDLTIQVSDKGGGITRSQIENLFMYHYTTAPQPLASGTIAPLAGYGYGLPLSRMYAKYFGGDIQISSMEGYGTNANIYLKAFSKHASEVLPLYNSLVAKTYDEADSSGGNSMKDWSSDSFYQGQNHSYSKPYLNFLRNKRLGSDAPSSKER
ncbi:probable [pyruvate dehydrogenase (acetyl-transferring)] kinase, mitochondrial isoform X2 [Rhopilema esculentum]|uniref:probable [pyruvate dehydrogenase (acetyl-transferring)] kinase, mitochondrial isoform X2 n=1 Tax=Rhopilema esculentum TaxID=499914 RepID=UPI0031DD89E7